MILALSIAAIFLALANGANDNMKGVATLYGSGSARYTTALGWATVATGLGSVAAFVLATGLVERFSGKGLVAEALAAEPSFLAAVGLGAASTVALASVVGMPVSTTHALVGALAGTGLAAAGWDGVALPKLVDAFLLPLVASPLLALLLVGLLYPLARRSRIALGVDSETVVLPSGGLLAPAGGGVLRYRGTVAGVEAQRVLDVAHFVSAGALSFARGLNDTPKIAALLVGARAASLDGGLALVGLAIATGGIFGARRVAQTISNRTTVMNAGQGFVANLVAAALVAGASLHGLPVSTTHCTCGGIFGIGLVTGRADRRVVGEIIGAWVATLPCGAALGAVAWLAMDSLR